ncbi:hypothetical protein L1987_60400 [Smallanthus sonchifolius]|uniref:Uncharacterized protein n=1 Tax=Smallanthus sonchifolius TaxID=185202 RepID=A0ACB9D8S8_9ASTR|nr:hypothetical protein L1987_60400 [Smallanthus sonchifolius]
MREPLRWRDMTSLVDPTSLPPMNTAGTGDQYSSLKASSSLVCGGGKGRAVQLSHWTRDKFSVKMSDHHLLVFYSVSAVHSNIPNNCGPSFSSLFSRPSTRRK